MGDCCHHRCNCCTCRTELVITVLEKVVNTLELQTKEIQKMAKTLAEAVAALDALEAKVDEDVAQVAQLLVANGKILEYIKTLPNVPADLQVVVDKVDAITAKLVADNPAIQAAIDASVVPTPPAEPTPPTA